MDIYPKMHATLLTLHENSVHDQKREACRQQLLQ